VYWLKVRVKRLIAPPVDRAYGSACRPIRQISSADPAPRAQGQSHTPSIDQVLPEGGASRILAFPIGQSAIHAYP